MPPSTQTNATQATSAQTSSAQANSAQASSTRASTIGSPSQPPGRIGEPAGDHVPEFDRIEAHDPEGHGPSLVPTPRAWRLGLVAALAVAAAGGALAWLVGGPGLGLLAIVLMLTVGVPLVFLVRMRATSYRRMARQAGREHSASARRATDTLAASRQDDDGGPAAP